MDDTIEKVNKLLEPAKALVTLWDNGKEVIKEVFITAPKADSNDVFVQTDKMPTPKASPKVKKLK